MTSKHGITFRCKAKQNVTDDASEMQKSIKRGVTQAIAYKAGVWAINIAEKMVRNL